MPAKIGNEWEALTKNYTYILRKQEKEIEHTHKRKKENYFYRKNNFQCYMKK